MPNQYSDRPQHSHEHVEERRLFVLECRRKAMTWEKVRQAVWDKFGYTLSITQLFADFQVLMQRRNAELNEELDTMRNVMIDQIDAVLEKHLELAERGSTDSAEIVLNALLRKSKLIGTDAPQKREVDDKRRGEKLSPLEILERISRIKARLEGQVQHQLPEPQQVIEIEAREVVPSNITKDSDQ